tara:strand:+ start:450 stop:677 length:228 start_codon:yes stop_codon:yes gene_type:complete
MKTKEEIAKLEQDEQDMANMSGEFENIPKLTMKIELEQRELKYLVGLITKEIYKMQESNVSFEGGYIDELYTKLK